MHRYINVCIHPHKFINIRKNISAHKNMYIQKKHLQCIYIFTLLHTYRICIYIPDIAIHSINCLHPPNNRTIFGRL